MVCLNSNVFKNPTLGAMTTSIVVMIYFTITSYVPTLAPAVLCSVVAGVVVYLMMGGKLVCDDVSSVGSPVVNPLSDSSQIGV